MTEKVCAFCKKRFEVFNYRKHTAKHCSRKCFYQGYAFKLNEGNFKKGQAPWNKGRKFPQFSGSKNYNWKGDKAKYNTLHDRVSAKRGKPQFCEVCATTDTPKKYEWANLTGNYADIMDYKRMCVPCHKKYDKERRGKNGKVNA